MIQEKYVSFEIAKLLKKKDFDEPCFGAYTETNHNVTMFNGNIKNSEYGNALYTAPTFYMATEWLREKYHIHADPIKQGNYNDCSKYYTWIVASKGIIYRNSSVADKLSYEEAVEAAIKYSLENLI